MQKTRRQILDLLKRKGSATLDDLATEIGLSAVTVRAHLALLERDDLVGSDEVRGRVGRPHFVYSLAEAAEDYFPKAYHLVAQRFLEGFKAMVSAEQMAQLVEQVAENWALDHSGRLRGRNLEARVSELARIRTEEGAMADWERATDGYILRQHHCPARRVAETYSELCAVELQYMRKLLGVPIEREYDLRGGQRQCSYRIPLAAGS